MEMILREVVVSTFDIVVMAAVGGVIVRPLESQEKRLVAMSFWLKVVFIFLNVLVTKYYFHGGDMLGYCRWGVLLSNDETESFSHLMRQFFQQRLGAENSSTLSMAALSGMIQMTTGETVFGTCLLVGLAAWFGQVAIYFVLRDHVPLVLRRAAMLSALFLPSLLFWTGGIIKEAVAIFGLGLLFLGAHWLLQRRLQGIILASIGLAVVAVSKAYILVPFFAGGAIWFFLGRQQLKVGFTLMLRLCIGATVGVMAVRYIGDVFPRYSIDGFTGVTAGLQEVGQRVRGGSTYSLGDGSGPVGLLPQAVLTALFRPIFFEVNNAAMALNAAETTVILGLLTYAVRFNGIRECFRRVLRFPILIYCVIFVLLMSMGVGLGSTNLGTLSRYRTPMMPFYFFLLLTVAVPRSKIRLARSAFFQALLKPLGQRRRVS